MAIKDTAKELWERFKAEASRRGFTEKVVGDYAFRHPRTKKILRLVSGLPYRVHLYEPAKHRWPQGRGNR